MTVSEVHPDFEIVGVYVNVEGKEPIFHDRTIVPLPALHFQIPEKSKYFLTLKFKVKNRTLKDLKYKQVVKAAGITVKSRECAIGPEFAPIEESDDTVYTAEFPEDVTPGGFMIRGKYNASSTYYAGDEALLEGPWTLEITKK
ncbi:hypothetical protein BABINDRAFT_163086 [Babjeviella inositovora NRRL Y-12698]|uniref:Rho GDP-dissociation inhibitor n=1 Tax=Babjeviella inositovora NRRL Y-12698 TaxID=984486 RepID=A0A1E3QK33_9ASCO|nr:uncharacterized protein BABINDRAFT_163086 [Babjeviella inositovora NRRL Y-12698]ODQ78056.1 hypothetical protein BABINDRAFT_163086 [Babjeviella inositovora NRRL Y-12698]